MRLLPVESSFRGFFVQTRPSVKQPQRLTADDTCVRWQRISCVFCEAALRSHAGLL